MKNHELKEKRNKLEVSQKELALKTGISRYKISDFECGYCELSPEELLIIESLFQEIAQKKVSTDRKGLQC